jgi:hypothetical protein
MKKVLKIAIIVLVLVFVIAQFVRPDRSTPPIDNAQVLESNAIVPADVKVILQRSCADCHSNATTYPWYSNISPASWWLQSHINDGRHELNFSEWGTYSPKKRNKKMEEVCEQVRSREMPLPSYLWIHRDAQMSDDEIDVVCSWTEAVRAELPQ